MIWAENVPYLPFILPDHEIENLAGLGLGRMRLAGLVVQIGISAPRVIRGTRHIHAGTGRRRSAQSVWFSLGGGVSAGRRVSAGGRGQRRRRATSAAQ